MEKYKVSIIIPIYNVEKYINKCIQSIIDQTYSNLEIILVDDGSIDRCSKICDEYANKDKRIKVIHKQNGGLSSARNIGIDISSGEYILFIDADDYIHESTVEILIKKAISKNADIVHFNFQYVDEEGNKINIKNKNLDDNKILNSYETICEYAKKSIIVMACTKLYKRELFDGLRFDEGYVYEDELIFPKIIYKSKINYMINDKLYYYVNRESSITKSNLTNNKIESKKKLIRFLEEFYLENYPELMRYIYIKIYFICSSTIKEIKKSNRLDNKNKIKITEYFYKKILEIYPKISTHKKVKDIPLKKELYCFFYHKYIKYIKIWLLKRKYYFMR